MNLKFAKSYLKAVTSAVLIGVVLTLIFNFFGLNGFIAANVTVENIQWGAVVIAYGILLLVVLSFIRDKKIANPIIQCVLWIMNIFVGIGFTALSICLAYYSSGGWSDPLLAWLIGGIAFFIATLYLIFMVSNIEMENKDRWFVCGFALYAMAALTIFIKCMLVDGKFS